MLPSHENSFDFDSVSLVRYLGINLAGKTVYLKSSSISASLIYTGYPLLGVQYIRSVKSNLCTTVTTQNATESNGIDAHAQDTTEV